MAASAFSAPKWTWCFITRFEKKIKNLSRNCRQTKGCHFGVWWMVLDTLSSSETFQFHIDSRRPRDHFHWFVIDRFLFWWKLRTEGIILISFCGPLIHLWSSIRLWQKAYCSGSKRQTWAFCFDHTVNGRMLGDGECKGVFHFKGMKLSLFFLHPYTEGFQKNQAINFKVRQKWPARQEQTRSCWRSSTRNLNLSRNKKEAFLQRPKQQSHVTTGGKSCDEDNERRRVLPSEHGVFNLRECTMWELSPDREVFDNSSHKVPSIAQESQHPRRVMCFQLTELLTIICHMTPHCFHAQKHSCLSVFAEEEHKASDVRVAIRLKMEVLSVC